MKSPEYVSVQYFPSDQAETEAALIANRRCSGAPDERSAAERVADSRALALSGGGIRSATFNLGLLQSLAEGRKLREFDYLSTVSGGGYTGGFLGCLFHRAADEAPGASPKEIAAEVEQVLASDEAPVIRWLRDNGRYLAPRGGTDVLFALAIYLRNMMAAHVLIGLLLLSAFTLSGWLRGNPLLLPHLLPGLLWLLPVACLTAYVASSWTYWMLYREGCGAEFHLLLALLLASASMLLLQGLDADAPAGIRIISGGLGAMALLSLLIALSVSWEPAQPTLSRNRLSKWSSHLLMLALALCALAAIDELAFRLHRWLDGQHDRTLIGAGLTGALLAALRVLAQKFAANSGNSGDDLTLMGRRLIGTAGLLLLTVLATGWAMMAYALNDAACAQLGVLTDVGAQSGLVVQCLCSAQPVPGPFAAIGLLVLLLLWLVPGRHLDFLNLSSLHPFYAARLIRAYLGAGNRERGIAWGVKPLRVLDGHDSQGGILAVSDAHEGDDRPLSGAPDSATAYAPHRYGGPVHLINVTVNQSRFSASGDYQPDRKGWNLAIGPAGYNRGRTAWHAPDWNGAEQMSLGRWMSISGAAFSSGAGPRTGTGFSALLGLLGVRLGYWWRAGESAAQPASPSPSRTADKDKLQRTSPSVTRALLGEFTGRFDPDGELHWYLSDGGHFENTGAYELIRRGIRHIVLADCGADPDYAFEDLANLVQKARIDFNAEIEFLDAIELDTLFPETELRDHFFAYATGIGRQGAPLTLARVRYATPAPCGWLLVVKPRLPQRMPADLARYAAQDDSFPQQTTLDQFYSESQWESTRLLGRYIGRAVVEVLAALDARDGCWENGCNERVENGNHQNVTPPAAAAPHRADAPVVTASPARGPTRLLAIYTPLVIALWTGFEFYANHMKAETAANEARQKEQRAAQDADERRIAQRISDKETLILSLVDALDRRIGDGSGCGKDGLLCVSAPLHLQLIDEAINELESIRPTKAGPFKQYSVRLKTQFQVLRPDPLDPTREVSVGPPVSLPATRPINFGFAGSDAVQVMRAASQRALIYVHIYAETQRTRTEQRMQPLREPDKLGIALQPHQLPGIENVVRTAALRGSAAPRPFKKPTVIRYHAEDKTLAEWVARRAGLSDAVQLDLSGRYRDVRLGVIEVWLPEEKSDATGEHSPDVSGQSQ